ncbi:unnamed protein product [Closterium sp. NIES-64]|nr:unnamed protein product [Closterium sp. NIES-64]
MKDSIYVDGKSLPRKAPPRLYFMVNKPKGYICSNAPQQEVSSSRSFSPQSPKPSGRERSSGGKSRPERVEGSGFRDESSDSSSGGSGGSGGGGGGIEKTAISLVEEYLKVWEKRNPGIPRPRLFTVGRLDVQTTGLLLVTNDGNFAQQIAHPSAGLTKEYVLTVQGPVTKRQLATMAAGTDVDGVLCTPVALDLVTDSDNKGGGGSGGKGRERVRVVVAEGRNREVRRLAEAAGLEVLGLKRVRIGSLRLPRDLGVGKYKALKSIDVERLLKEKM